MKATKYSVSFQNALDIESSFEIEAEDFAAAFEHCKAHGIKPSMIRKKVVRAAKKKPE